MPFVGFFYWSANGFRITEQSSLPQNILDIAFLLKSGHIFDTINRYIAVFKLGKMMIGLIYLINLMLKLLIFLHWCTCFW